MTYSSSRAPLLLLEDSGSKRRKEFDSLDGGACHMDKSAVKSCVNKRYHSTFSNETETDSAKLNDKPFKCDALFMFLLFSLAMGAFIIVLPFLIYFDMFDILFISISYLLLSVSLGVALVSSSIWRILQYCPLNCCLECIKETHAFNIFCIVLGLCLMALAVIGLLDEFSDSYKEHDHIRYPLWLDLSLFVVSIACFMFVSWVNTQYARMQKEKRIFLQNYYYNKMIADEGAANDYKQNEDKIPTYIQKNGPLHPYDRSIFSFIFHTFTHFHLFDVIRLGSKKTLQTFDCYFPPKPDDIEYNFDKWRQLHRKQQKEKGKGKIGTFSLLWAIESKSFMLLCVISLVSTLPGLVVPTIIGKLANFYEDLSVDLYVGITLTVGLLVIGVIRIFFGAMLMTFASCVAGRVNGLLSYVIYHKAINMSISNDSTAELCTGQKVTLLAADTRMIAYALAYQPIFVAQYIMMAAVIILLHVELGISALAGWLFVIVISFPVQSVYGYNL